MKEILISVSTAILAKEKGFILDENLTSFTSYRTSEFTSSRSLLKSKYPNYKRDYLSKSLFDGFYCFPTQSLLQKWLRDIHKIDIEINVVSEGYKGYNFKDQEELLHKVCEFIKDRTDVFSTYEEALELELERALNSIEV